jgi:hypothetical protein
MNRNSGLLKVTVTCLGVVLCWSASVLAAGQTPNAQKIIADAFGQDSNHDLSMKANFQIFDKQGNGSKKEFIFRRVGPPGGRKTEVVFTAPTEIRGVALLSITQDGFPERQFVYTPATDRVRNVVPQERSSRFIGTDFTFEDIGERVESDFTYGLIGAAETMEGHKTYKIEATPMTSSSSQYKYIYYWVAQDIPVILYAEMYDAQGQKMRVLHATDIKKEGGIWGARHTEMRTIPDGTRTVLTIDSVKFNTKPDEKLFTPQGLSGALGAAK